MHARQPQMNGAKMTRGWLSAGFGRPALLLTMMIWGFSYVLIDVLALIMGYSAAGLILVFSIPMFALGVSQTMALDGLRRRIWDYPYGLSWPVMILATLIAAGIQFLFDLYWLRWVANMILPRWQEWALVPDPIRLAAIGIIYLWTFCLALALLWAAQVSGAAEASAANAAAAAARAEAAVLRLQLNPHFMFNTLNSISSLVLSDRKDEADRMIDRLCEFLRGSLYSDPTADVPLAQEIDSIDAYLSIESARFGDELEIDIDIAPDVSEALVPNFILQPLVENAVKHGASLTRGHATISVTGAREGEMLVLGVSNSTVQPDQATPASESNEAGEGGSRPRAGIGLANIRQRLANRYGKTARLETGPIAGGFRAVIRIPFVDGARREGAGEG